MKTVENINKEIYLFSCKDVPFALISCIIENISNYKPEYNKNGRVGLMGISYDQAIRNGKTHIQMFDTKTNIESGVKELKRLISEARSRNTLSLENWYLLSISAFLNGGKIGNIDNKAKEIWEQCKEKVIKKT